MHPQAFFLPVEGGQRFCIFYPAQGPKTRGRVLYAHPFAEEMNKSRRMVALQARHLSEAGFSVLQLDLQGCGDSSGDFGDATWQGWRDDLLHASDWLRAQAGDAALWLWGLRAGCLLAAQAAQQIAEPCQFLFWAPAVAGKPLLQQFLRLKAAGEMMGGNAKGVMDGLRQQLAQGQPVEVAGYTLAPGLTDGLEKAVLAPPSAPQAPGRVEWFELSTRADAAFSPAVTRAQEPWQQAGFALRSHLVEGPSFWQTTEIEDAPALVAATTAALAPIGATTP
ncbi:MAG TPA: hydrolase 2, exosortase A system-associated [Burkholderiaceae bacterium]|nr:hydrolase 2, exosortase A system-associated [Burkholderiaceae bacterium]